MNLAGFLPRRTLAYASILLSVEALSQCPGVRPRFSWQNEGSSIAFMDATDGYITDRTWSLGNGQTGYGASLVHGYDYAGIDTVTLTVTSFGCSFSTIAVVAHGGVNDACGSTISSGFGYGTIGNNTLAFTDQSQGDGSNLIEFWYFGDDSISLAASPVHFYALPGAYDVTHSIATLDSLFQTACVAGSAERLFVDGNTSTCDSSLFLDLSITGFDGQAQFDAQAVSFSPDLDILNWSWDYGDGSVDISTVSSSAHYYAYPGEYQVCVEVSAYDSSSMSPCYARACKSLGTNAVGVEEVGRPLALRAYPIPFDAWVAVEGRALVRGASWWMFDGLARQVSHGTVIQDGRLTLVTEDLPPGPYVLRIQGAAEVSSLRILKQ